MEAEVRVAATVMPTPIKQTTAITSTAHGQRRGRRGSIGG